MGSDSDNEPNAKEAAKTSLVSVSANDIFGFGKAATAFFGSLERGLGAALKPWLLRREALARQDIVRGWLATAREAGLTPQAAGFVIDDEAVVRIVAERELIAANGKELTFQERVEIIGQTIKELEIASETLQRRQDESESLQRQQEQLRARRRPAYYAKEWGFEESIPLDFVQLFTRNDEVPDLGRRASSRAQADLERQQFNREAVAAQAVEEFRRAIKAGPTIAEQAADVTIESEWVDRFWRLAEDISTERLQALWGRILARQCSGAGRCSARTLDLLSTFAGDEADELTRMAACTCRTSRDGVRQAVIVDVLSPVRRGTSANEEAKFDVTELRKQFSDAIGKVNWRLWGSIGVIVEGDFTQGLILHQEKKAPLSIGNQGFRIEGLDQLWRSNTGTLAFMAGHAFSPSGIELLDLINTPASLEYVETLRKGLNLNWLKLVPQGIPPEELGPVATEIDTAQP